MIPSPATSAPASHVLCSYVCARQYRDDRLQRGADQRSVILISELPYSSILSPLAAILGPALFPSFRSAAAEVMHACSLLWPPPVPGTLAHLTIGPHRVVGRIPLDACLSDTVDTSVQGDLPAFPAAACLPMCGSFCEPLDTLEVLLVHSKQLWKLWEVMLLAHPVMVFSCSAAHSSAAVCALVSLIAPVPYSADYRPLLSIHDPAAQSLSVRPPLVLFCLIAFRKSGVISAALQWLAGFLTGSLPELLRTTFPPKQLVNLGRRLQADSAMKVCMCIAPDQSPFISAIHSGFPRLRESPFR